MEERELRGDEQDDKKPIRSNRVAVNISEHALFYFVSISSTGKELNVHERML